MSVRLQRRRRSTVITSARCLVLEVRLSLLLEPSHPRRQGSRRTHRAVTSEFPDSISPPNMNRHVPRVLAQTDDQGSVEFGEAFTAVPSSRPTLILSGQSDPQSSLQPSTRRGHFGFMHGFSMSKKKATETASRIGSVTTALTSRARHKPDKIACPHYASCKHLQYRQVDQVDRVAHAPYREYPWK